ncbi:MAG: hypothetical protein ABSA46_10130 [Thermodesulfovibrionales bacterium]
MPNLKPLSYFFLSIAAVCSLAPITACGGVSNVATAPVQKTQYTYVVPKAVAKNALLKGLFFEDTRTRTLQPYTTKIDNVRGITTALDSANNRIFVTAVNGVYYRETRMEFLSSIRYVVDVSVEETPDTFIVTLSPVNKEITESRSSLGLPVALPDERQLVPYLSNPTFPLYAFRFEKDSPYNTDSIWGNFKRMLKSETKQTHVDPETKKVYSSSYVLRYHNKNVMVYVDVYPYHNGSKAVVKVDLPVMIQNHEVEDITSQIEDIRNQIEKIIES